MLFSAWLIARSRRVAVAGEAAERESRFRRINLWILIGAGYFIAVVFSSTLVASMLGGGEANRLLAVLLAVLVIAPLMILIYVMARFSQQWSAPSTIQTIFGDRTPDEGWYLGLLYYNRNDPAIMVEKRFGFGYTLNMARPASWAILIALVGLPLLAVVLL